MKRRQALQTLGAAALALGAETGLAAQRDRRSSHAGGIVLGDSHFLSTSNPTATADQRDAEALAMRLQQHPAITAAKAQAAQRFRVLGRGLPDEAWRSFDAMMDDWAYHYTLIATNSDPLHPRVVCGLFGPPHAWFGMQVRASHGPATAENPDVSYSFIPVDGASRYELQGRRFEPAVGDCPIYVAVNLSMTLNIDSIAWQEVQVAPDGSFTISIGPNPTGTGKDGRRNHLTTTADTRFLYTRDARIDWRQWPHAYRVRRLDPVTRPPLDDEAVAALAARYIGDDVGIATMYRGLFAAQPLNVMSAPEAATGFGGQKSQKLCRAHLRIEDDEAFVITLLPGGAAYHVVTANNLWLELLDYWNRTASLNNRQSVANTDGSYTYVVSLRDPGVHNWIDTAGLHEVLLIMRLQMLPRNADGSYGGDVKANGVLVKLVELDAVLPKEMRRVTAQERAAQLATRYADLLHRFTDR